MSPYRFRPFTRADLPMAARWLRTPDVARWWGDLETELTLLGQDLDEPAMRQWIVEHRGQPFAYVQAYRAGFIGDRIVTAKEGPVVVMLFQPARASARPPSPEHPPR
jgi:hypothetical protein